MATPGAVPDAVLPPLQSYSHLLLTDEFYAAFAHYEYMLITQDDVYVLRDDLPHWLPRQLDYIGPPVAGWNLNMG